jgi:hypothetical protein
MATTTSPQTKRQIKRHHIPTIEERPTLVARDTFGPLGMSDTTGYELIRRGEFPLPLRRVGGRWFVLTRDLREYLGLDPPIN